MDYGRLFKKKQTIQALILLLPALTIALLFIYYPAVFVLNLSFKDWDLISPNKVFVGFENYIRLGQASNGFWNSFLRTGIYTIIFIPVTLVFSLYVATRLVRLDRNKGLYQALFFVPSVTAVSVISLVWSYLFNPQIGPINLLLTKLGVPAQSLPGWFNSMNLALPTIAIIGVWQNLGFMTLLFIAGLQNIPKTYYEVASLDGASRRVRFFKITLPLLSPVLYYVLFLLMINSFKMFDIISILTKGRPQGSTNVLLYYVYQQAFQYFDAG